ncbi:hypothetical protein QUF75_01620 [Desulfococcaceae bacterium HSG7]|nr:hypothetical protein [Desulfococcaceae bacterium HSG7]
MIKIADETQNIWENFFDSGEAVMANGQTCFFISKQTEFQKDILSLLGVPHRYFTYGYLFYTG